MHGQRKPIINTVIKQIAVVEQGHRGGALRHLSGAGTIRYPYFKLRPSFRDHKDSWLRPRRRRRLHRHHLALGLLVGAGSIAAALVVRTTASVASIPDLNEPARVATEYPLPKNRTDPPRFQSDERDTASAELSAPLADTDSSALAEVGNWKAHVVAPGDNLSLILQSLGVPQATVAALMTTGGDVHTLRNLRPGQLLYVRIEDGVLEGLRYDIDALNRLEVDRTTSGYAASKIEHPSERIQDVAQGTIESSLYMAAQAAGLSDRMVLELAEIFGWDIDFTLDLRPGDRFSVVYEEIHSRGERIGDGPILAAEFVNRGKVLRAVRYTDTTGRGDYYTPAGHGLRKAFSRNPLPITRITSRFNPNRLHPIFRTRRPHRGVDYGAPTGTPVRATGDGVVVSAGRKGGYGNAVVLQHGKSYRTLYGHLSRFASGMRAGRRVRQGDVIAYVGATGWATGPHLHYEFQINGVHKDPLKVELPKSQPIPEGELASFKATAVPLLAALDAMGGASHAAAATP